MKTGSNTKTKPQKQNPLKNQWVCNFTMRRERDHSQKEMSLIYLLFNELSTNHFAFPIKTVQIVRGNTLVIHPAM